MNALEELLGAEFVIESRRKNIAGTPVERDQG